jgi:predicted TIM-barrel fold metal-dependent hydrolase
LTGSSETEHKAAVSFPPDPNPKTPRMKLPPGSWDTHFHVVGPPHTFPYEPKRWHTPPAAPIEHYLAIAEVLGLERGCTVQTSAHGLDTAITLDAIRKSQGRLCGVIRADTRLEDADIRELHAAGVRGMRLELRRAGGAPGAGVDPRKQDGAYEGERLDQIVTRAARASWVIALHIDPTTLVESAEMIRRMPTQTIIENFASMDARAGLNQPALRTLIELAQEPHVWLKTASADRMLMRGASYAEVKALAQAVYRASPHRTIWGTDWPHPGRFKPNQMPNDGNLVDMFFDFVPDETARHRILVDNPKRLFDFA